MAQVGTEPCPECQKKGKDSDGDNLCLYDDGSKTCHACGYWEKRGEGIKTQHSPIPHSSEFKTPGDFRTVRDIPVDVCRMYGYTINDVGGHIAPYYHNGKLISQAIRWTQDGKKCFRTVPTGNTNPFELFGQHLWNPDKFSENSKKILVITEGELDCMAAHKMLTNGTSFKSPVVSISNGVGNAVKHVKSNYEWVDKWDSVVICFDMDEVGQEAAQEVAELFPGKAKIMSLPLKDACDMLKARRMQEFRSAFFDAKTYRPDEIIHISEVVDDEDNELPVYPFCDDELTTRLIGMEAGELVIVGSGSGMGKSTWTRKEILNFIQHGLTVGCVMLEESPQNTRDELCGIMMGVPVRKILGQRKLLKIKPNLTFDTPDTLDDEELKETRSKLAEMPLFIHKHNGALDSKNLVSKLRYLAVGCDCKVIVLDHISLVVAGRGSDERTDIDRLMKNLVSLKEETGVIFIVVSQFSSPDGKAYEEGAATHLNSFRGSRSMGHAADIAIGIERNQQAETEEEKNLVTFRSLKARRSSYTGIMCRKYYDKTTGDFTLDYKRPDPFLTEDIQETLDV
jgi:twinkle protein